MADSTISSLVTGASPWTTRAEALKATALINVDAERKVIKLTEEVRDLHREIRKRVRPALVNSQRRTAKLIAEPLGTLGSPFSRIDRPNPIARTSHGGC
jgi:hypothetical protein